MKCHCQAKNCHCVNCNHCDKCGCAIHGCQCAKKGIPCQGRFCTCGCHK